MVSVLDRSLTLCLSRVTKKKVLIFISSICRAILPEYSSVQSLEAGHPPHVSIWLGYCFRGRAINNDDDNMALV